MMVILSFIFLGFMNCKSIKTEIFSHEFWIHKALEPNSFMLNLGSEGNAFGGSPSHFAYSGKL